jgi:hypothetical protein
MIIEVLMARFHPSLRLACFAVALALASLAQAALPKSVVLCDFERNADPASESRHYDIPTALKKPNYVNHDFRWNTSGYASLAPINKEKAKAAKNKPLYKFFQGKNAARVRFTVPGDYKTITPDNKPKSWETGMTLASDSYTPLKVTDWRPYRYLAFSAYNPGDKDRRLFVRFSDSAAATTQTSSVIPAGGPCTVEIDLSMLSHSRLNTALMRGLTFYLDTADEKKDIELIFDNIGLHGATYEERKKAEVEEDAEEDEEEDWDEEEEEEGKVDFGVVSRPTGISGKNAAPVAKP